MEVSKQDYSRWRKKFKHGDATQIHELSIKNKKKVSRQAISGALNGGSADSKTIEAINNYYQKP